MKRFLSLALLALFCLVANVARADVGDIIHDDNGVAYSITSESTVSVAKQCTNSGVYAKGNSVVIPETVTDDDGTTYTVTAVGENAFYDTTYAGNGGIDAIELPTTITSIEDNAFNYCTNLTTIDVPEGVTKIGAGVFANCTALKTISLPSTLTSVGTATDSYDTSGTTFSKCTALTSITCLATTAPTLPSFSQAKYSPFNGVSQAITLWVPCGSADSYSTWVSMMSSYSAGGSFTVSELDCESEAVEIDYDNCTPEIDSSDPIELTKGEDATFTIAFTGAVKLDESGCYINAGGGSTVSVTLEGVGTEEGDGYYTQWNITVSADVLSTYSPEITIVIAGEDSNGNTLFSDDGGYVDISYYYSLVSDEVIELTFDPASGSTVTELGLITVTAGDDKTIEWNGDSDYPVYDENGDETDYIVWDDTDEETTTTALVLVVNDGSYTATGFITEAGTYYFTLPAGTFKVDGTSYDEAVTLTYTVASESSEGGEEEVSAYGTSLGEMTVGTEDSHGSNYYTTTSGTSYYVTYTPTSDGTLYLSDSDILCYDDTEGKSQITGSWVSNGINAEGFTLTAGTTYYFTFTGSWMGEESFTAWYVADESSDVEVSEAYGESLGEMEVGTEDSHASYSNTSLETKTNYYMTYTPDADGTLSIISSNDVVVYADAEGQDEVSGSWEGTTVSYALTGGTTYYIVFTSGMLEGSVAYTGAWYVAMDTSVSYDFSVVSVTAADGTDLTGNITADNTLDLAVLEDGMQMVIYCSEAAGNYLNITFGTVGTEQYLTMTSDRLTADEDGNFTWTGGWDYELTEGYTYPVVCDLYNAAHNGTLVASATVLTLVGTSENKVSDVTLVSSDPDYNDDIEFTEGEDGVITLTFSDYVNISAEISQGLYGSITLEVAGVEGTGDGNGNYTQWTVTIPASELEDEDYGGEITISISGTDADGKLLFDASGYSTFTYSYTLTGGDELEVSVTFDPESDTTVESLTTITVTGVVTDGTCTSLEYISYSSDFAILKDDAETSYELYYNEDAEPEDGQLIFNIIDTTLDEEGNENWEATITDAGVYTIVIPGNTFSVNGVAYEEPVTLTYTIESTEEITLTFDPASGSTVTELGAITVSSEQGAVTYISYDSDFAVSVNGEESDDYIAWYDEEQDADGTIVMVVNDGSWSADEGIITDAGEYSITFPAGTFAVSGTSYDEAVTLTYTIESTSNEGGEGEGEGEGEEGGDATGISAIQAAIANGAEVYTISGQKVNAPVSGVNVVKYADGTVKKILQK